jgi:EF-P beta-lysylation protein EpmB
MRKTETWQVQLSQAVRSFSELCELLELQPSQFGSAAASMQQFPLRVPRGFVARMEKGNTEDPLLLQVLPQAIELEKFPGYSQNALQEKNQNPIPGLLHKYRSRVLLTLTGGCAVNCRYCFRRHFSYTENQIGKKELTTICNYLKNDPSIEEVILSGGDPLLLQDQALKNLIKELATIPTVKRLRFHTRFPVVIPERITEELIEILTNCRLQVVMVLHINHANEIDNSVKQIFLKLKQTSITVLNQAVLLKGVNNSGPQLIQLSQKLFEAGILPYYLHLLDKVDGSAHFEVPEKEAFELYEEIQANLSGYLVPKLVREVPGAPSKVLLGGCLRS